MNILLRRSNTKKCITNILVTNYSSSAVVLGRPWKYRDGQQVIHQSYRKAESADINFHELDLKYPLEHNIQDFAIPRTTWNPPPQTQPKLPFFISRSEFNQLPVYTDYKAGNTKVVTLIRKIKGDIHELQAEVEKIVGKPVKLTAGGITIDGNYRRRLKVWLTGLGF